mgnify:FL=1
MNKWQKEILQSQLNSEQEALKEIEKTYKAAIDQIDDKIAALMGRTDLENLQSIIYQLEYQKALKKQISGILDTMNAEQFQTLSDYLTKCYEDGFVGTLYDLQGQGIPLIFPIDQNQVTMAVVNNSKISEGLYNKLGYDVNQLKKTINNQVSRGIATGLSYADIARNISRESGLVMNKTYRIARTEGHRISNAAAYDAQKKAKDAGANVVKQWDAALDKRTRPHHAQLDGQIREINDPFEIDGHKAMYPGQFGVAAEDCNCRCASLQRAKWALDDEELQTLKDRAAYYGLDKTKDFEEFKQKYIDVIQKDPLEGKLFHMLPDGTLVEGEIPGMDVIKQNGLTGEVTVVTPGTDYKQITWSMNDDSTLAPGIIKYQAQYKIDIDNYKILKIDVDNAVSDYISLYGDNIDDAAKFKIFYNSLPKDLTDEIANSYSVYGGAASIEDVTYAILKKHGYEGIYASSTKDELETFFKLIDDSKLTKTKKSKFETLAASLAKEKKKLAKIDNKVYTGIWKDDVSVSDYALKKGSIQAKRDWYLQQLASGSLTPSQTAQFQKYLDDLDEFETLGKQYESVTDQIKKIQNNIKKFTPVKPGAYADAYTDARKNAAYWFTSANGSTKGADAVLRQTSGDVWRNASPSERKAIWGYTSGSGKYNRPLSGFQGGWGSYNYKGVGNVPLDYEGAAKDIKKMTDIINRSEYNFDIWLQRGCQNDAIESFLNIPYGTLKNYSESQLQQFIGTNNRIYSFLSTSVSKGNGFSGSVIMNVYAPSGSKMMYAEPFSAFGQGAGKNWDGISAQGHFGYESEMILQRGGSYTITKIEKTNGTIYIDVEVHPEDGYDLIE